MESLERTPEQEKERQKMIEELDEKIRDMDDKNEIERLINDNTIEFQYKDNTYRVIKPTLATRQLINYKAAGKKIEMLKDDNYVLREELIKLYKGKGIDIDKLDSKYSELRKQQDLLLLKLAKIQNDHDIDTLKSEIIELRFKQHLITLEKSELLSICIEHQLDEFIKSYSLFISLEINKEEHWVKAFATYEDMMNSREDELVLKSAYYLSSLIFYEKI